jgi:hypothetical protein
MANVEWVIKNYDTSGNGVTAADMTPLATVSNTIKHAANRNLNFFLNGVDQLNLILYLDDPMALQIRRLHNVIKVWRTVRNDAGSIVYSDPEDSPCFSGVVGTTLKSGEANTMNITAFSPLWRLQSRFHLLNHYLKTNVETGLDYKQSELLWKLIDLVNEAFGYGEESESFTGIAKGTFASGSDPVVAPQFVAKGSNTFVNFDEIMSRPGGIDIIPEYKHFDGDATLMLFSTDEKRGNDISDTIDFRYRTGTADNLDDITEEEAPIPTEFANFLWAVGQGGPNSGKVVMQDNVNDDDDGYDTIGVYMRRADFPDIKRIGTAVPPPPTGLTAIAQAEFAQSRVPKTNYTASLSPAASFYYAKDFSLGDVVMLNADKGALHVVDEKQRIYDISLNMSDNNMETPTATISKDFTGKVAV